MCKWNIVSVLVTAEIRFCYWHLNDCFYTFFIQLYISLFPLVSWQMWKREHTRASNLTFLFVTQFFCLIYVAMLLLHIYILYTYKKWARFTSKDVLLLIHLEQAGKRKVNTTLLYIFSVSKKVLKVNKENYVCEFLRPLNRLLIKRKPYVLFTYTLLLVKDKSSY